MGNTKSTVDKAIQHLDLPHAAVQKLVAGLTPLPSRVQEIYRRVAAKHSGEFVLNAVDKLLADHPNLAGHRQDLLNAFTMVLDKVIPIASTYGLKAAPAILKLVGLIPVPYVANIASGANLFIDYGGNYVQSVLLQINDAVVDEIRRLANLGELEHVRVVDGVITDFGSFHGGSESYDGALKHYGSMLPIAITAGDVACGSSAHAVGGSSYGITAGAESGPSIADLAKYTDSMNAVTKDKVVDALIGVLVGLGFKAEGADRLAKIKSILEKIPSGDRFVASDESHKRICTKIAEALNNVYGSQLIDPALDPVIVCKQVLEIVNSLATGMHSEFLSVYAEVKTALNNINILDAADNENLDSVHEKIVKTEDTILAANTAANFDIHKMLSDEKARQLLVIKNLLNINLLPTERDISSLLKSIDENSAKHIMKLEWKPGQSEFGKLIEATIRGIALTASFGELINSALKKVGMTVDEYAKETNLENFMIRMTDLLMSRPDMSQKEREEIDNAIKLLYKNFYRNSDIAKFMSQRRGSCDNIDNQSVSGGCGCVGECRCGGVEKYPRSAIDKRVRSIKTLRKLVVNAFYKRLQGLFTQMVGSLDVISKKVGSEIPLSDNLEEFRRIVQRMRDQLVENKNIYLALVGFYNDALSLQKRETLIGDLRMISSYVDSILEMDVYRSSAQYFRDFQNSIKAIVELIEKYSNEMATKFGRGENADPDAEQSHCQYLEEGDLKAGGDDDDDENDPFNIEPLQIRRTSKTIYDAFRQFDYYYRVAQIRDNLNATSKELDAYGEKYSQLVAGSVAAVMQEAKDKYEAARAHLENVTTDDLAAKGAASCWDGVALNNKTEAEAQKKAALKFLDDQWNARKRFWATIEAIDSYMRAFTNGIAKDPGSVRDIKSMLDDIEVLAETYNDTVGERMSRMFDLFPKSVNNYTSEFSVNKAKAVNEEYSGHYYDTIAADKPGNPYLLTDPKSGQLARAQTRQVVGSLGMLKNLMSVFIYISNKFNVGKTSGELHNQIFMTPVQIYNNLVEYITASAFAQGFVSEDDKIKERNVSTNKFVVPGTWSEPNSKSVFGVGIDINTNVIDPTTTQVNWPTDRPIDDEHAAAIAKLNELERHLNNIRDVDVADLKEILNDIHASFTRAAESFDKLSKNVETVEQYSAANRKMIIASDKSIQDALGQIKDMLERVNAVDEGIKKDKASDDRFVERTVRDIKKLTTDVNKLAGDLASLNVSIATGAVVLPNEVADALDAALHRPEQASGAYDGRRGGTSDTLLDAIKALIDSMRKIPPIDYSQGITLYRPNRRAVSSTEDASSLAGVATNNWVPGDRSAQYNFKRLYGVWMRSVIPGLSKYELVGFEREDEHFVMMMKALAAKIFTVTGMYDVLDRPHEINSISPIRMIIGGAEATPKIEPGAVELYYRLPLLAQFYRDLFNFDGDDKSYQTDVNGLPRRGADNLKISMVPEVEGVFSGLIKFIFRRTKDVYETAYTDDEMKQLVSEINIIYQRMQAKHGDKVTMATIREFIDEMNRRYAIVSKDDHDKYVTELEGYEYNYGEGNNAGNQYDKYGRPIDVNVALLPGEGDWQVTQQSPAEKLLSGEAFKQRDPLAGHRLDRGYYKLLYRFRCCIDKLFENPNASEEYTFKNAIRSAQLRLKTISGDEDRFRIVSSLVRGVDVYSKVDGLKYLLFHETVVVGLNTLSALHTVLQTFRDAAMLIDLHKFQELMLNELGSSGTMGAVSFGRLVTVVGDYCKSQNLQLGTSDIEHMVATVFGNDADAVVRGGKGRTGFVQKAVNGLTGAFDKTGANVVKSIATSTNRGQRKGDVLVGNGAGFMTILSGYAVDQYKAALTSGKSTDDARDRIMAFFRVCFDHEFVMKVLVELLYGICGDSQSIAEFRVEDGRLFIDVSGIKKLVEDLFTNVSYFIDSLRPFVTQECMDKYTNKINPGSYYWLHEQIMEKLIKGRPPQSATAAPKIGYVNIEEACRKLTQTYDILTLKYNYDLSIFNGGQANMSQATKHASYTSYDKVFAEMLFYDAALPQSGLLVSEESHEIGADGGASGAAQTVNYKSDPYESLHVSAVGGVRTIDTRFIARFKQLYSWGEEVTMNRSALFMFNQLVAKYIRQFFDPATQKIYINSINGFANGAFNQSIIDFMYTYPDISPRVFARYEEPYAEKIDSRQLLDDAMGLPGTYTAYTEYIKSLVGGIQWDLIIPGALYNGTGVSHLVYTLATSAYSDLLIVAQADTDDANVAAYINRYGYTGVDSPIDEFKKDPAGVINEINALMGDFNTFPEATYGKYLRAMQDIILYADIAYQVAKSAEDKNNSMSKMFVLVLLKASSLDRETNKRGEVNKHLTPGELREKLQGNVYTVPTIYRAPGSPLVDYVVKYDDIMLADMTGEKTYGTKTTGTLRAPTPGELADLKGGKSVGGHVASFGNRMDPDGSHVLFTSIATVLKNLITSKNPTNQQFVYLCETISDVPNYMKEKYRAQLPLFRLYFRDLAARCETIRKFVNRSEINLDREWTMSYYGKPTSNPWPHVLLDAAVNSETARSRFSGVLDTIVKGCTSMIACCDQVLRETGDDPKYLETYSGSIRDYKTQHGVEPFMPISSLMYVLNNNTSQSEQLHFPSKALGHDEFKMQFGTRLVLSQPHVAFGTEHMPGYKQLLDSYNSLLDTRSHVDVKRSDEYVKTLVKTLRWLFELRQIKGRLTTHISKHAGSNRHFDVAGGKWKRDIYCQGSFTRGDIVFDEVRYNDGGARDVPGTTDSPTSINYIITNKPATPISIVNSLAVKQKATEYNQHAQKWTTPAYSFTHTLQQLVNLTESGMREDRVKELIKYITDSDTDARSLVIQNIIDLNVIPINVHALMREIPLANIYNYAYTFDRLIIELYYGLQNDNARKLIGELCRDVYEKDADDERLSSLSSAKTAKDMLVALLVRPYMTVHGGDGNEHYELTKDMLIGVSGNELGRPKFLSDQLYGKAIFGELYELHDTYSEMGPAAGRESYKVVTQDNLERFIAHFFAASNNSWDKIAEYQLQVKRIIAGADMRHLLHYDDLVSVINAARAAYKLGDAYRRNADVVFLRELGLEPHDETMQIRVRKARAQYSKYNRSSKHRTESTGALHYLATGDNTSEEQYGAVLEPDNENVHNSGQIKEITIEPAHKQYLVALGKFRFNTVFVRNLVFVVNLYRSVRLKLQRDLVYNREIITRSAAITDPSITEFRGNAVYTHRPKYGQTTNRKRYGEHTYERYRY